MNSRKRKKENPRALCAWLDSDDGVDPRDMRRRDAGNTRRSDRKLSQLCKQVEQTLQLAFGALPQADAFAGVWIRAVFPAPNAGRLCVVLSVPDVGRQEEVDAILRQYNGRLRFEVAEAISRRHVPELTYQTIVEGGDV